MVWVALTIIWFILLGGLIFALRRLYVSVGGLTTFLKQDDPTWGANDDALLAQFSRLAKLLILATLLVWIVVGFSPFLVYRWGFISEPMLPEKLGEFSDAFGFANTFFSGLAFGGVIIAIVLQTIELRYQRQEIRRSNEEYRQQTDSLQKTAYLNAAATLLQGYSAEAQMTDSQTARDKHVRLVRQVEAILRLLRVEFQQLDASEGEVERQVAEAKLSTLFRMLRTAYGEFKNATEADVAVSDSNRSELVDACKNVYLQLMQIQEKVNHAIFSDERFVEHVGKTIDNFSIEIKSLLSQLKGLISFTFETYRPEGRPYIHRPNDPPAKPNNYDEFQHRLRILKKNFGDITGRWQTLIDFV